MNQSSLKNREFAEINLRKIDEVGHYEDLFFSFHRFTLKTIESPMIEIDFAQNFYVETISRW